MWSSVPDDILAPDFALPSQLKDIWHKTRAIRPERALALAVLEQSMEDLRKFRFADRRRQQRLYMEAYRWVMSNDGSWPYSFVCLCDQLGLEVEPMRRGLLGDAAPVACSADPWIRDGMAESAVQEPVSESVRAAQHVNASETSRSREHVASDSNVEHQAA
jgi:hypothetical protein